MITSRSNFSIKLIRSLSDKAARDEHSLFVAEGVKTVKEALASGFSVERVAATVKGFSLLASAAPGFCRLKISTDGATCAEKRDSKTELYTGEKASESPSKQPSAHPKQHFSARTRRQRPPRVRHLIILPSLTCLFNAKYRPPTANP